MTNSKNNKSFSINIENLHETVSSAMNEKPDLVSFREIQGESAKILRTLSQQKDLVSFGDLSKLLEKHDHSFSRDLINKILIKHLNGALTEIKDICVEIVLEEITPVDSAGNELLSRKKSSSKYGGKLRINKVEEGLYAVTGEINQGYFAKSSVFPDEPDQELETTTDELFIHPDDITD